MINEVIICIEDVNVLIYMMLFYDVFFVVVKARYPCLLVYM